MYITQGIIKKPIVNADRDTTVQHGIMIMPITEPHFMTDMDITMGTSIV